MNNICNAYVSQVKAMLPVRGKNERKFVRKLHGNIYDYCEDNKVTTIDELYKGYGTPQEIVFDYISLMEPDVISKRINTARYIKSFVVSIIILTLLATSFLGVYAYSAYKTKENFENSAIKNVIEYY